MGWGFALTLEPNGERFKKLRKLLQSALNNRNMQSLRPLQERETQRYLARLLKDPANFREDLRK
jgi:cytochrome P450